MSRREIEVYKRKNRFVLPSQVRRGRRVSSCRVVQVVSGCRLSSSRGGIGLVGRSRLLQYCPVVVVRGRTRDRAVVVRKEGESSEIKE